MASPPKPIVVGLGESLFDCFADREVLGGAPLNVALHADALLRPLGGAGVVATRVGRDEFGDRLLSELDRRGLDTSHVQRDERLPTGRVEVTLNAAGDAEYRFSTPSAWDALEPSAELMELASRCDAIAFGTLGQRSNDSRQTIRAFLDNAPQAVRLFDLNLRQDYFSTQVIRQSLHLASAAKLNEDEAVTVGALLGLEAANSLDTIAALLVEAYELDWLAITRGERGTLLYTQASRHEGQPALFEPHPEADTVGAGDACSAGLLYGVLQGWPPQRTLTLANRLGAYVASQPGATPQLPDEL